MNKGKFSERNRRYVLRRSQRHRPICTCGTYLKNAYVQDRTKGKFHWIKVGYYCPACPDFYKEIPEQTVVNLLTPEAPDDIGKLKHNLEKMFSKWD